MTQSSILANHNLYSALGFPMVIITIMIFRLSDGYHHYHQYHDDHHPQHHHHDHDLQALQWFTRCRRSRLWSAAQFTSSARPLDIPLTRSPGQKVCIALHCIWSKGLISYCIFVLANFLGGNMISDDQLSGEKELSSGGRLSVFSNGSLVRLYEYDHQNYDH